MASYGQFCPVAKAAELLDQRWTLLVLREMISGTTHFNDLRRGVPKMSPSLLSKRLKELVRAGVVERHRLGDEIEYRLTAAGRELRPVIEALGVWGTRWVGELGDADYDPHLLLWDMHRRVDTDALPDGRTVVRFRFDDVAADVRDWWLVLTPARVDVCDFDPGYDIDVAIETALPTMVEIWRGDRTWHGALRTGAVTIRGITRLRRAVPSWFLLSTFAQVPRSA